MCSAFGVRLSEFCAPQRGGGGGLDLKESRETGNFALRHDNGHLYHSRCTKENRIRAAS